MPTGAGRGRLKFRWVPEPSSSTPATVHQTEQVRFDDESVDALVYIYVIADNN